MEDMGRVKRIFKTSYVSLCLSLDEVVEKLDVKDYCQLHVKALSIIL